MAFDGVADENKGIVSVIERWNSDGIKPSDIAVFAYETRHVDDIADALRDAGVDNAVVGADTREEKLGDVVRVMTMHRAKGLEFRGVILARTGATEFPPKYVTRLKGEAREREMKKLRSVLYVAGSRARERMTVTCAGSPSEMLENA